MKVSWKNENEWKIRKKKKREQKKDFGIEAWKEQDVKLNKHKAGKGRKKESENGDKRS